MKNADDMMKEIIKVVDTNGDGKIQYEGVHSPRCGAVVSLVSTAGADTPS